MSDLLSVIVGGSLTFVGGFAARAWDHWRDARALREAFRGEIASILDIAEARGHEAKVQRFLELWALGEDVRVIYYGSELAWADPVYQANVGRIGLVGIYASEIAAFYTRLRAVRITVKAFEDRLLDAEPLPFRIAQVEEALQIWREAKAIGAKLTRRL